LTRHSADSDEVARLLFLSYRYSQGGLGLQLRLLSYMRTAHYPALLEACLRPEVQRNTRRLVGAYFSSAASHPACPMPWDEPLLDEPRWLATIVSEEMERLFAILCAPDPFAGWSHEPSCLAASIISMDLSYLQRVRGRAQGCPRSMTALRAPYRGNPFQSVFIEYAGFARGTGHRWFDALFLRVGSSFHLGTNERRIGRRLTLVWNTYWANIEASDERQASFRELAFRWGL
jgi:hypothetical protein